LADRESIEKDVENIDDKQVKTTQIITLKPETTTYQTSRTRKKLFNALDVVLETCQEKFARQKARNTDRQRWARIIVSTVATYEVLLKDSELEEIEIRLSHLERQQEENSLKKWT